MVRADWRVVFRLANDDALDFDYLESAAHPAEPTILSGNGPIHCSGAL
jgi:hypothetical protein